MLNFFNLGIVVFVASIISLLIQENEIAHDHIKRDLNTTVVILNWSRLANVRKIVSSICTDLLQDTVHTIIVWNNNPNSLTYDLDFQNSSCPKARLRIINSPQNLYFQARFMACVEATTPYCFIQDDDFLVRSEIIRALSLRASERDISAIHLQPPDEMLTSQLRTVTIGDKIQTTFAWLGYGTILQRSRAMEFLSILNELNLTDEEHKMADNYFTILSNMIPERWFDASIELGGGQPFTVGTEGEERNNRHIIRATGLLDSVMSQAQTKSLDIPYVSHTRKRLDPRQISRAPCHYRLCVFESNIKLLPELIFSPTSVATEILMLEKRRLLALNDIQKSHYLMFPPSCAVDGRPETAFRSPENAMKDDWISLDLLKYYPNLNGTIELVLQVDSETEIILQNAFLESSEDGHTWIIWEHVILCSDVNLLDLQILDVSTPYLEARRSCRMVSKRMGGRYFRVRSLLSLKERWIIYSIHIETSSESS